MGATNRSALAYVLEVTKGTTPASPAMTAIRSTSNGLEYKPTRVASNEIRPDRQITDQILTDFTADGPIGIELSYSAFDDMLQAAIQGTWVNNPSALVTALTTTTASIASGGASYVVGMLVLTTGFTNSANNNIVTRVSSNTGTTVVCPSSSFTPEASPPAAAAIRVVGFMGASGDLVATVTGGNAITSTALDFTTLGLIVGEWVHVGGDIGASLFATTANNGWCRISVIAASRLSFDIVPTGWSADTGTSKTIQVFMGDFVSNSTTQRSFTFERQQQDLTSPSYEYFIGMEVDQFSLSLKAASIITGSVTLTGRTATAGTTRASGATDVLAPTYGVMNAASNIGRLAEGGVAVSGPSYITEMTLDLNNNLARKTAVGNIGSVGTRDGEISVSGTLNAYFGDLGLLNKVLGDTGTSIMFRAGRSDGNRESLIFDVPQCKLEGTAPISGKNADRMFSGKYDAYRHATLGYTISAERYWYLPVAV